MSALADFLLARNAESAGRKPERDAVRRVTWLHEADEWGLWCLCCASEPAPCPTLRFLALPYADHPDYNEEWRP